MEIRFDRTDNRQDSSEGQVKRPASHEPYCGPLSPNDVAKGTELAASNARDLFRSAEVLFGVGHFAQSAALAILAIEELQKVFILLDLLLAANEAETKRLWSEYRRHSPKQTRFSKWLRLKAHREKKPSLDIRETEKLLSDPTLGESVLELRKQVYLYTDNFQGSGWSVPSSRATREDASKALAIVELVIAHTTLYSAAELAIWKKHLVGIDAKSRPDKRSALLEFAAELDRRGFQKPNWFETMLGSL
jgi:AbiV family abortive infection protein